MGGKDPELNAAIRATARLDSDAARARLTLAAGGSEEDAAATMNPGGEQG
ncbi:hypothetical protein [Streptosporangium sp. NPDC002607]